MLHLPTRHWFSAAMTILLLTGCPSIEKEAASDKVLDAVPGCDSNGNSGDQNPHCLQYNLSISAITTLDVTGSEGRIVSDSHGNIFHFAVSAGKIIKVDPNGIQSVFATYGPAGGYGTLAIDSQDNLYVAAPFTIAKISPNGTITPTGVYINQFPPLQMAVDGSGNIYYTESDSQYRPTNIIKKITPQGVVSVFAGSGAVGSADGNGASASFNQPRSLIADSSGNIFVVDTGNYRIRKISPNGDVTTFAGTGNQALIDGVGLSASFYFWQESAFITIDSSDNLYLGDNAYTAGYLRKITPSGVVTTICGNGSISAINVPGSCNESAIWVNYGLTVSPLGKIYYISGTGLFAISE